MAEYQIVNARVEYVVQISFWDRQHNCPDGTIKYGIFPTEELAAQWFIEKGYIKKDKHYWNHPKRDDATGEILRRIVELDAEGYNV